MKIRCIIHILTSERSRHYLSTVARICTGDDGVALGGNLSRNRPWNVYFDYQWWICFEWLKGSSGPKE